MVGISQVEEATVVTKALRGKVLHKRRVWVIRRTKIHPKGCGLYELIMSFLYFMRL